MTRLAPALAVLALGCGSSEPIPAVTDVPVVVETLKLDLLFVIDDSAGMCREEIALAASVGPLLLKLEGIDYRIVAVTTDVLSEEKLGVFQYAPATEFPFACGEMRVMECHSESMGDETCAATFGPGWACQGTTPETLTNCNGSVNSKCRKTCMTEADCDSDLKLPKGSYICLDPTGDPARAGCVPRPPTASCPTPEAIRDTMTADTGGGAFLTPATAPSLLPCVAVVGAFQHNNANLESGLAASWLALDPDGPNAQAAKAFLRDDAWLAVIYVGNDEDCSTDTYTGPDCDPASNTCGRTDAGLIKLKKEQYGTCGCLADSRHGGPLMPVDDVATRLRALKSDPTRIFVAAIAGDSMSADPETQASDRAAYMKSKCSLCDDPGAMHPLLFNSTICASEVGQAEYGSRFATLVAMFGDHGAFANYCAGVGPGLAKLGDRLLQTVTAKPTP